MSENWEQQGTFTFPAEHSVFTDHVPAFPVVPGSLIINAFLEEIKRKHPQQQIQRVERFRFRSFVRPAQYSFLMQCINNQVRCTLHADGTQYATGILLCK